MPIKVYTGSSWDECTLKVYNGTSWVIPQGWVRGTSDWLDFTTSFPSLPTNISATNTSAPVTAGIRFYTSGATTYTNASGGWISTNNWVDPIASADSIQIKATVTGGSSLTTGTTGSWITLSGTYTEFSNNSGVTLFRESTVRFDFRFSGTTSVVSSSTITITATEGFT